MSSALSTPFRRAASLQLLLSLCVACASGGGAVADRDLLRDVDPALSGSEVNAIVEIPCGTNDKWEVQKDDGRLEWEVKDGVPRVVDYAAYPGNYGMIPRSLLPEESGGDGDPLDVLVLGPAVERGAILRVRIIGVLKLQDEGEQDDKLLAVRDVGPLSDVQNLADLDRRFHGVSQIVELWFTNYKGPGRLESRGYADQQTALEILQTALHAYGSGN